MKRTTLMNEDKLIEIGVNALMERLGPVEATRFLALRRKKRTESVRRHRAWQSREDKDVFFDAVFGPRRKTPRSASSR